MAKVFIANFTGFCSGCDDQIKIGDEVSYCADELLHAECNEDSFWYDPNVWEDE